MGPPSNHASSWIVSSRDADSIVKNGPSFFASENFLRPMEKRNFQVSLGRASEAD